MNETVTNDILHRGEIGQQMFEDFVTERLTEGKLSVWEKMTKRKLGTYKSANASTEIRVGDNVVKIKEKRGLLQRFIVISRSRPKHDLKECIGTYEFGMLPRSWYLLISSFKIKWVFAFTKNTRNYKWAYTIYTVIRHHINKLKDQNIAYSSVLRASFWITAHLARNTRVDFFRLNGLCSFSLSRYFQLRSLDIV